MAINYLNTVNLNKNSLESARIHNLGTEPTPDTPGEIYFNTTSQAIKVTVQTGFDPGSETYAWEEVGSDSVIAGTGIVITPGTGANAGNSIITNSGLIGLGVVAGSQSWAITQSTNTTTTFASASSNEITVDSPTPGTVRIGLPADVTISNDLTVSNDADVDGALTVAGTLTSETSLVADGDIFVNAGFEAAAEGVNIKMGGNRVEEVGAPTSSTDAATKSYVDTAVTGLLEYQGAYNPVTNTPDLDRDVVVKTVSIYDMGNGGGPLSSTVVNTVTTTGTGEGLTLNIELNQAGNVTSATVANGGTGYAVGDTVGLTGLSGHSGSIISIDTIATAGSSGGSIGVKKGWTYTVVADGDFYGEKVRVGDVLIAESDDPGDLVNWTTVQNNVDLASSTQVGLGNVAPGAGIDVTYSSGTATVTNTDTNSINTDEGEISAGDLSGTITHNWGTAKVIVQTYRDNDTDNYPTVFCDITRTSNTITATIAATETDDIVILAQKIG